MSKLFIYYTHTGNGDLVAETMRSKGYEIRKITPRRDLPRSFVLSILKGGFLAGVGHSSKLVGYNSDVSGYDRVAIGSPVWNGKLSCPINTVLEQTDLEGKDAVFILYSGGGNAPKAVNKLNERYGCPVIELREPSKNAAELEKLAGL